MRIYISGLYSGTNPQPGVGVARSLRLAYPGALLIGVEYSNRCSGIHWPDLDELWLQRPWDELDLDTYEIQIKEILEGGGVWISGVDLELMWLASVFPDGHKNLLTPPPSAIKRVGKPAVKAHEGLPVRIPEFISTEHSDWELHAFCRQHNWKVWLKGPYYEAVRTGSWDVFEVVRGILSRAWSTERLFLQTHVTGYEESVCFCAYQGELLGSVYMRKRELTEEGKTWAGDVTEVPEEFASPLREIVRGLNWTGGAELEMVRDPAGTLWLLECNPRFPAWIHGATIAGRNLPALMVEAATGIRAQEAAATSEEFTRVVLEIPVRPQFPLPPLPEPYPGGVGHSLKHPSGTLALAERLHKLNIIEADGNGNGHNGHGGPGAVGETVMPPSFINDLKAYDFAEVETPSWLFLESTASSLFERAGDLARRLSTPEVKVTNAYSIKTNPDERLLRLARANGFMAEAISLLEVQKALKAGFKPEQVVLNGPGKWWPEGLLPDSPMHAVFCDSVPDLRRVVESMQRRELRSKVVGVRLRTPNTASRFGIPVDSPASLRKLVEAVETLPPDCSFGVHFHMASSNIGVRQWWHLYESMLRWAHSIETLTARKIEYLDVGGGWFPDDWHTESADQFAGAIARARGSLRHVREIISEPGKALAQPSMALAMRLLEFEEKDEEVREAVVDGSIAELPMHFFQPHRILHRDSRTGECRPLRRGKTMLLGRLCMEHDIVARGVELPEGARAGDLLVFCDAGGYDRSMSYVFGRG
ncbi:MAG TPA: ATP-grasp domain-containing protein [Pyrinomonadaceae bacterium]|jgi:diaminopimelate decarboxylase|nr:ATP-grasp domain-containing protein [Pyrinomonadaceae bacterium]